MKMQKNQRGMAALSMIMIIVVLLAVIGTVVATSRTSTTSTSSETSKLHASSIIDQGNTLRTGVQIMANKGTASLADITNDAINTSTTFGLYNGTTGGTVRQSPPADAISNPAAKWLWFRPPNGIEVSGVSGVADGSFGFALTHVRDTVCRQINAAHYGATHASATTIPAAATASTPTETGASGHAAAKFSVGTFSGTTGVTLNWNFGCVATGTANQNVYFNIVQP